MTGQFRATMPLVGIATEVVEEAAAADFVALMVG
jgi:hypothetical protein